MATTPAPADAPAQDQTNTVIDTVLHDLIYAGILAASIFVKSPASKALAGQITNIVVSDLLPLADAALMPPKVQ